MVMYLSISIYATQQLLTAVILSNPFLSIYVCLSADSAVAKCQATATTPGVTYLKIAHGQTKGLLNIFPSAVCEGH